MTHTSYLPISFRLDEIKGGADMAVSKILSCPLAYKTATNAVTPHMHRLFAKILNISAVTA